jgi:hypothetical protein
MKKIAVYAVITLLSLGSTIGIGYFIGRAEKFHDHHDNSGAEAKKGGYLYACPMLCTVVPEPGECPVCGMVMQQIEDKPELELSDRALKLAEVEVATVKRQFVQMHVGLIGEIDYDESRMARISADFPGRIDKLFVDYGVARK